jgi:hypothetical protein
MDSIISELLGWQFVLFSLAIMAVTSVIRKIVEFILESIPTKLVSKTNKIWTELLLPILPVILGAVLGVICVQYPFPMGLSTDSGRVVFGLVAGLLSGLLYRVIKSILAGKLSTNNSETH